MDIKDLKDKISIKEFFNSLVGWSMFIFVNTLQIIILPVVLIITLPFDKDKKIITYFVKIFCNLFYFLNFLQHNNIDYNNLKPPKKGERRIYAINHASMFDVILMFNLPGPIKSVMKESYTKIPVIGWIAMLLGNIILPEEDDGSNRMAVYMKTMEKLERGTPVAIFPEGTKSKDSKIGKFYHGTFKLALDTKSDIVPVVFDTWNVIRPDGLWIRDVNINIKILDTIKYDDIKDKSYREISRIIRIKLMEGLINLRNYRRNNNKYYRNKQKYIDLDNEMLNELNALKEKYE
jgi:1-acyl-sn-glycerol-3-phosphate acyltransferase